MTTTTLSTEINKLAAKFQPSNGTHSEKVNIMASPSQDSSPDKDDAINSLLDGNKAYDDDSTYEDDAC
eukprot:14930008-Ditylum_brightwellii.AAC.1